MFYKLLSHFAVSFAAFLSNAVPLTQNNVQWLGLRSQFANKGETNGCSFQFIVCSEIPRNSIGGGDSWRKCIPGLGTAMNG